MNQALKSSIEIKRSSLSKCVDIIETRYSWMLIQKDMHRSSKNWGDNITSPCQKLSRNNENQKKEMEAYSHEKVSSLQGRPQGGGSSPPPETEKIVVEKWSYFPELQRNISKHSKSLLQSRGSNGVTISEK